MKNIPCVILCGGKSSRMEKDKTLLPFGNYSSLAEYQYRKLKKIFKDVYLSAKTNKFNFIENENIIFDKNDDCHSPIVALKRIFETLKTEKIFIITVDTPLIKETSIETLLEKSKNCDICIAKTQRTHSLCGVFSRKILPIAKEMIENDRHKVMIILDALKTNYVNFDNEDEFINLNNKEEYKKALKLLNDKLIENL